MADSQVTRAGTVPQKMPAAFGKTNRGRKRPRNTDALLLERRLGLFLVSDGFGGQDEGETASTLATDIIRSHFQGRHELVNRLNTQPLDAFDPAAVTGLLTEALVLANRELYLRALVDPVVKGSGCSTTLLWLVAGHAAIAHVGVARCYLLRSGRLLRLTEDHRLVDEQLRRGLITFDEALAALPNSPLTRALGADKTVDPEILLVELTGSERLMLCTDGLTLHVNPSEIESTLATTALAEIPATLIDLCNRRGGFDNVTVVAVETGSSSPEVTAAVERRLQTLQGMSLFRRFRELELLRMLTLARTRRYRKGETVIREGEEDFRFFVCIEGIVQVIKDGRVLASLLPGDFFGEAALLDRSPRSADVIAIEDSQMLVFEQQDFYRLINDNPRLAAKLLWKLSQVLTERLRSTVERLWWVESQLKS